MRYAVMLALLMMTFSVMPYAVQAEDMGTTQVDLILPPVLASADAPFYRGAKIKMDDRMINVTEGSIAGSSLAQYDPDRDVVIVSNSTSASEIAKGQALLDVVSALQVNDIATAAGQ